MPVDPLLIWPIVRFKECCVPVDPSSRKQVLFGKDLSLVVDRTHVSHAAAAQQAAQQLLSVAFPKMRNGGTLPPAWSVLGVPAVQAGLPVSRGPPLRSRLFASK